MKAIRCYFSEHKIPNEVKITRIYRLLRYYLLYYRLKNHDLID
jgi:hypothetical protein